MVDRIRPIPDVPRSLISPQEALFHEAVKEAIEILGGGRPSGATAVSAAEFEATVASLNSRIEALESAP